MMAPVETEQEVDNIRELAERISSLDNYVLVSRRNGPYISILREGGRLTAEFATCRNDQTSSTTFVYLSSDSDDLVRRLEREIEELGGFEFVPSKKTCSLPNVFESITFHDRGKRESYYDHEIYEGFLTY